MQKRTTYWLIGCAAIILLASGCFQPAGSNPQSLSVADNTGATFTPPPTLTPLPTLPPEVLIVTPTPDFSNQQQAFEVPTLDLGQSGGQTDQTNNFVPQQVEPLDMTATWIVQQATDAAALQLTGTACALGLCAPTAAPFPSFVPTVAPVAGADCIHEVRAGDKNLYRISLLYGVTVDAIVAATTPRILNPDIISIGQRLTIPGCGTTGAVPPPTSTSTFQSGGVGAIPTATAFPSSGGSAVAGTTYIVKQGDTLFAISLQTGVPVQSIADANGIQNIDLIYLNQQLIIPSQ
jgi:LysM repeat protein